MIFRRTNWIENSAELWMRSKYKIFVLIAVMLGIAMLASCEKSQCLRSMLNSDNQSYSVSGSELVRIKTS